MVEVGLSGALGVLFLPFSGNLLGEKKKSVVQEQKGLSSSTLIYYHRHYSFGLSVGEWPTMWTKMGKKGEQLIPQDAPRYPFTWANQRLMMPAHHGARGWGGHPSEGMASTSSDQALVWVQQTMLAWPPSLLRVFFPLIPAPG